MDLLKMEMKREKKVKNKKVFSLLLTDCWMFTCYKIIFIHTDTHTSQFQEDPKWKEMTIKNRNRKKAKRPSSK